MWCHIIKIWNNQLVYVELSLLKMTQLSSQDIKDWLHCHGCHLAMNF